MKKTEFIKASEIKEHIQRHVGASSLAIGSKALKHVSEQSIRTILARFDEAYLKLMDKTEIPHKQEFCLKANAPVGTDAMIVTDNLKEGALFEVINNLGTPYAAKVKVALISPQEMPTTNLVHGIYGPYGNSGKAGLYTMTFGHPGMPLPKDLAGNEAEPVLAFNQKCCKFWHGEEGKGGHAFLATPEELASTISQMKKYGLKTKIPELRLEAFFRGGCISPLKNGYYPSRQSENAIDLGHVKTVETVKKRFYE